MSDTDAADRLALKRTIRSHIREHDAPTWRETAAAVVAEHGVTRTTATDELRALERSGFLYRVAREDGEEVLRVP